MMNSRTRENRARMPRFFSVLSFLQLQECVSSCSSCLSGSNNYNCGCRYGSYHCPTITWKLACSSTPAMPMTTSGPVSVTAT